MNRAELVQLVVLALQDFLPPNAARPQTIDDKTVLFGPGGLLDSIALVSFIVDVEEAIRSASGVGISLADARAMSQTRSPFRTVGTLADYAEQLLRERPSGP